MLRHHVSAPRKLAMLAAAAAVALGLSACGGGGGGGTATGGSGGGPSGPSGGGSPTSTGGKTPSLTAGGVRLHLQEGGGGSVFVNVSEGDVSWADTPTHVLAAPSSGGWTAVTKVNPVPVTHRFHGVTDIASFTDADYLAYGHWAENFGKPTERPDFKPFYYGNKPYTGSVPASTATATYTGGAAGIYETGTPGTWGYFRSDISLSANFGTGKITGTLSNFSILSVLSPSFNFSNVTTEAATISDGSFTQTLWGGRFFGPSGAAPTGAAGWFEGLTSAESGGTGSATLHGSFAAQKQ